MTFLLKLFALLPLWFLQGFGALFGELTFRLSSEVRQRTIENLKQAGLDHSVSITQLARSAGRQSMESLWVWYRSPNTVMKKVTVDPASQDLIDHYMRTGRPIVFMTPHVGCFEVLPVWFEHAYYGATHRKIMVLYRPPKNPWLRKVVGQARQSEGIEPCPTTVSGVKRIIKNLRLGHTFGALPDQVPSSGEGVWASFFGRDAYTMVLPLRVAKQFNAVRIFAWGIRTASGWEIQAKEWTTELTGDLEADASAMNYEIEQIIRAIPDQYAWSYNRYKTPKGAHPNRKRIQK